MNYVLGCPIRAPMISVCVVKALNAPVKHRIPVTAGHVDVVLTWNVMEESVY